MTSAEVTTGIAVGIIRGIRLLAAADARYYRQCLGLLPPWGDGQVPGEIDAICARLPEALWPSPSDHTLRAQYLTCYRQGFRNAFDLEVCP